MKRAELERIRDQLTGGNADTPNGHNLVGSINAMLNTYDEADTWGATPDDAGWQDAREDFQHILKDLSNALPDLVGNDAALEDDDGNTLASLPNAASQTTSTKDVPDTPSN